MLRADRLTLDNRRTRSADLHRDLLQHRELAVQRAVPGGRLHLLRHRERRHNGRGLLLRKCDHIRVSHVWTARICDGRGGREQLLPL